MGGEAVVGSGGGAAVVVGEVGPVASGSKQSQSVQKVFHPEEIRFIRNILHIMKHKNKLDHIVQFLNTRRILKKPTIHGL